jgi:alkylhydroperoxidase family enzyme
MVDEILIRKYINPLQEKLFDKELQNAARKLKQDFDPYYNLIQVRARTEEEYKLYLDLFNAFGQEPEEIFRVSKSNGE